MISSMVVLATVVTDYPCDHMKASSSGRGVGMNKPCWWCLSPHQRVLVIGRQLAVHPVVRLDPLSFTLSLLLAAWFLSGHYTWRVWCLQKSFISPSNNYYTMSPALALKVLVVVFFLSTFTHWCRCLFVLLFFISKRTSILLFYCEVKGNIFGFFLWDKSLYHKT